MDERRRLLQLWRRQGLQLFDDDFQRAHAGTISAPLCPASSASRGVKLGFPRTSSMRRSRMRYQQKGRSASAGIFREDGRDGGEKLELRVERVRASELAPRPAENPSSPFRILSTLNYR
jgi:hypothetical protein